MDSRLRAFAFLACTGAGALAGIVATSCGRDWSFLDAPRDGAAPATDGIAPDAGGDAPGPDGALPGPSFGRLAVGVSTQTNWGVSCVLRGDVPYCWGRNQYGQLGRGGSGAASPTPAPVVGPDGGGTLAGVARLTVGYEHACALRLDGEVYCWGAGDWGALGSNTLSRSSLPTRARTVSFPLEGIAYASCGHTQCCTTGGDGGVNCWGKQSVSQLTSGIVAVSNSTVPYATPVPDPMLAGAKLVVMGPNHACAVLSTGGVACWGLNDLRQAGQASSDNCNEFGHPTPCVAAPKVVSGLANVTQLALSEAHTCALSGSTGAVDCWGRARSGQLGIAPSAAPGSCVDDDFVGDGGVIEPCTETPRHVMEGATQITAGGDTSCAIKDGRAMCWGSNGSSQLSQDGQDDQPHLTPVAVKDDTNTVIEDAVEIALSRTYACLRKRDDTVWCWGYDETAAMGTTTGNVLRAKQVVF